MLAPIDPLNLLDTADVDDESDTASIGTHSLFGSLGEPAATLWVKHVYDVFLNPQTDASTLHNRQRSVHSVTSSRSSFSVH